MASIVETLVQFATPEVIGQVGQLLDIEEPTVRDGLGVAGPLLLGAMARRAATPDGAAALLDILAKTNRSRLGAVSSSGDGDILEAISSSGPSDGDGGIASLLGVGRPAVEQIVWQEYGIALGPILALAAPMVTGLLSQRVNDQHLDAAGLTRLLQTETGQFAASNSDLARVVSGALAAGDQVVERVGYIRASYSADEWEVLVRAPLHAAEAVMAASPNRARDVAKELAHLLQALLDVGAHARPDSLLGVLSESFKEQAEQLKASDAAADEFKRSVETAGSAGLEGCVKAAAVLNARPTPEDASGYKQWLLSVATGVAEAAREGSFFGLGGRQVSAQEQATLNAIAAVLGVAARSVR